MPQGQFKDTLDSSDHHPTISLQPQVLMDCLRGREVDMAEFLRLFKLLQEVKLPMAAIKQDILNEPYKFVIPTSECMYKTSCTNGFVYVVSKMIRMTARVDPLDYLKDDNVFQYNLCTMWRSHGRCHPECKGCILGQPA